MRRRYGSNAGSGLTLVNGADEGHAYGGSGRVCHWINDGKHGTESSDFAIAELIM